MKTLFIMILITYSCFADYQLGKIDMHGGKESYLNDNKKSAFTKRSMGVAIFLDNNATKKATQEQK